MSGTFGPEANANASSVGTCDKMPSAVQNGDDNTALRIRALTAYPI